MSSLAFTTLTRRLHRLDQAADRHEESILSLDQATAAHAVDLSDLRDKFNVLFAWGKVSALTPLTVTLQGSVEVQPGYSLLDPATLTLNDPVVVMRFGDRIVILGRIWAV